MASSRPTSSALAKPLTPRVGMMTWTSTPSMSMSATRAWESTLTRSVGHGGPFHWTPHGVPEARLSAEGAVGRLTFSRLPSRRWPLLGSPTIYVCMPPRRAVRAMGVVLPARASFHRVERYFSSTSQGSYTCVSESRTLNPCFPIGRSRSVLTLSQLLPRRPQERPGEGQDYQDDQSLGNEGGGEDRVGPARDHQGPVVVALDHLAEHEAEQQRDRREAALEHDVTQQPEREADHDVGHEIPDGEAAEQAHGQDGRDDDRVGQQRHHGQVASHGEADDEDHERRQREGDEEAADHVALLLEDHGADAARDPERDRAHEIARHAGVGRGLGGDHALGVAGAERLGMRRSSLGRAPREQPGRALSHRRKHTDEEADCGPRDRPRRFEVRDDALPESSRQPPDPRDGAVAFGQDDRLRDGEESDEGLDER